MNKRLLRIAKYLGNNGMYKEAAQLKKLAESDSEWSALDEDTSGEGTDWAIPLPPEDATQMDRLDALTERFNALSPEEKRKYLDSTDRQLEERERAENEEIHRRRILRDYGPVEGQKILDEEQRAAQQPRPRPPQSPDFTEMRLRHKAERSYDDPRYRRWSRGDLRGFGRRARD